MAKKTDPKDQRQRVAQSPWLGLARPMLVLSLVATTAAMATYTVSSIKLRDLKEQSTRLSADLEHSAARVQLLENLLKRSAADAKPLFESSNSISSGPGAAVLAAAAVTSMNAPAAGNPQPVATTVAVQALPTQARQDAKPASMVTTVNLVKPAVAPTTPAAPPPATVAGASPAAAKGPQSTLPAPHMPNHPASTAGDTIKVAAAIAPVLPSAEQVASARRINPTEVVSSQQLGLQSLQPRQAVLKDGRMIGVGDVFPSGDRLLAIDIENKQLITDKRTIILF